MKKLIQSLSALPLERIGRHPELVLVTLVGVVIAMMIVPVPTFVMDVLLAVNVTFSAVILVSVLFSDRALAVSSFPTLLLLTTLTRLSLNVSTTRLILAKGDAGEVVRSFGEFVLSGDIVVGLVIFAVVTLVQFMVIAKGAERVAEVGARFTLDAMPGKQMSIDAAVRSGALTEEQGQAKRDDLGRESQFYGAMDGAMKFIKGDAIAGLIITAINLVAGMVIGVMRFNLSLSQAVQQYSILSVGDGLISQIPALLITLAAGILTTRIVSKDKNDNLGANLRNELFSSPKVLAVGGAFALILAVVPGLPFAPFALIALGFFGAAAAQHKQAQAAQKASLAQAETGLKKKIEERVKQAKAQRAATDNLAPAVVPVAIDVSAKLSAALGLGTGDESQSELVGILFPQMRDALHAETGIRFPGVRVRSGVAELTGMAVTVRVKDVPVATFEVSPDHHLAMESVEKLQRLGVVATAAENPFAARPAALVPSAVAAQLEAAGVRVWSPASVIALHLVRQLRKHAKDFIGLQETAEMVERLEKVYPALVKEVVPKIVSLPQLTDILRRLVDEGVCIRDLKSILEALAAYGQTETDGVALTEIVRASLSLQLGHAYAGTSGRLPVILLDPVIEDTVRGAITTVARGTYLALEPEVRRMIIASVARTLRPAITAGIKPIILTSAEIRRYVRKLIEEDIPEAAVLSFQELPGNLAIQPLGRAVIRDELAAGN